MPFAKHDDMVDAFPTDRVDEPFDIGVLPGRARRCRSISDAERPKAPGDDLTISAISITNEVLRSMLPAARLRELSSNPFRGRVCGCGRPQDPAPVMLQDKKAEAQAKGNGRDHEKIHRRDAVGMIAQEGLPALRRRSPPPRHIRRHARLPDIDTELEERDDADGTIEKAGVLGYSASKSRISAAWAPTPFAPAPASRRPGGESDRNPVPTPMRSNSSRLCAIVQSGTTGRMVAVRDGNYTHVPADTLLQGTKSVDVEALYDSSAYRAQLLKVEGMPMFLY